MEKSLAGIICAALGLFLHLNTLSCGFSYDDVPTIQENADLRPETPWTRLLGNDFWGKPLHQNTSHKSYRPLCVATFRLNYLWHGLAPMGYHVVNVGLHAVVCYLYVQLCVLIFKNVWPALLAGLLFAAHPIHTEAVTSVVGRADLLCAVCYLVSLLCYHRCRFPWQHSGTCSVVRDQRSLLKDWAWLFVGVVFTILAMLSKEYGIMSLGVCLMEDFLCLQQHLRRLAVQNLRSPQLVYLMKRATVLVTVGVVLLVGRLFIMKTTPIFSEQDNEGLLLTTPYRQLHWAYLGVVNLGLLFFPSPLQHDYRMNVIPLLQSLNDPRHILTLVAMTTLIALFVKPLMVSGNQNTSSDEYVRATPTNCGLPRWRVPGGPVPSGLVLLVVPFLPASNLFFPVGFVVAERVLYLPSMGFCLLVACSIHKVAKMTSTWYRMATWLKILVVFLIFTYSAKTISRNRDWKSKMTLYQSLLRHFPTNGYVLSNMARELKMSGRYDHAEQLYRHSLHVAPHVLPSYVNLASLLQGQSRIVEAEEVLQKALPLLAQGPVDREEAASVYTGLCNLVATNSSRLQEAEKLCETATQIDQGHFKAHNSLGTVLVRAGKNWRAVETFKKAAALNRTSAVAEYNLALSYHALGKDKLALETLQKVLVMERGHPQAKRQLHYLKRRLGLT